MKRILSIVFSKEGFYIFCCIVIYLSLTVASIYKFSVWHDEGYTATLIENGFRGIVERTALDVHPPLYYLILKVWALIFGDSIIALRLFSTFTMLGAIMITWSIFRKLFGVNKAKVALLFMSLGPFLIRYGQEMRMYGLVALLTSASTYLYVKSSESNLVSYKKLILYSMLISLGIYTHYFFILIPLSHFIHNFIYKKNVGLSNALFIKKWMIILSIVFLLFLPWLPSTINKFINVQGAFWIEPVGAQTLINTPLFMVLYRNLDDLRSLGSVLALATLFTVIYGTLKYYKQYKNSSYRIILLLVTLPPILLFVFSLPPLQPSYYDRYFSFIASFFYGSIAVGILSIKNQKIKKGLSLVAVGLLVVGQINQYIVGNDFEEKDRPYYTMNELVDGINDIAPIYATSLNTFFDARTTARDKNKGDVKLLVDEYPTSWVGNWSALYKRPELIVEKESYKGDSFWLIEDKWTNYSNEIKNYNQLSKLEIGYARLIKFVKVK